MFRLIKCLREYKKPTVLTLIFIIGEAIIETLIPFITANLINGIQTGISMKRVAVLGIILILMAMVSLCFGGAAGLTCSKASSGFAKNIRSDVFSRVQEFAFQNIDRFSSSSLVTRMTTDVTNVQMAYMMLIRTAVRAPLMLIFSVVMAFIMGGALATSFVIIIPVLVFGLLIIAHYAMPAFRAVFRKYDKLNESIEENVRGMRVVKGFAREEYEKKKFGKAAENIRADFTKAERVVAMNTPLMQICVYFNMVFVLLVGSKLILRYSGTVINVGEDLRHAELRYADSHTAHDALNGIRYAHHVRRIYQTYLRSSGRASSLTEPENPVFEVKDGSIDFSGVSFSYSEGAERYALSDINLHIKSGMTVGILGGTGSSKSSLVQLIPRLYDTTAGTVSVGGVDVRKYDLDTLRGQVAMVLQKNMLFSGTIRENLKWGETKMQQMKSLTRFAA